MTGAVLLTGGFGNVGGRFSSYLNKIGIADLKLATRRLQTPPSWAPDAQVKVCDLTNPESLKKACAGVDTIFHFAALNDRDCLQDPERAHQINVVGTSNLVDAAVSCGVQHIVYMSTIHVYGAPLIGHFDESSPTDPKHPYGLTHLDAERILRHRSDDISSTIIRCGNGFGRPMSFDVDIWHILVNDLCVQAVRDRQLVLKSPSNTRRNFVTLGDVCRALYFLGCESPIPSGSETFNLGSIKSRALGEMARLIAERSVKTLGIRPVIIESAKPTEEETSLEFDSSKLRDRGFLTEEKFELEIDGILDLVKRTYESN